MKQRLLLGFVSFCFYWVPGLAMSVVDLTTVRQGSSSPRGLSVVFLHGLDSSSKTWRSIMPQIAASENLPCIAVDLRGSGTSPLGDVADFSQEALVEDVKNALGNNEEKIVLVGHSLGGRIAMAYAAAYPEQIAALVVEDMDIVRRPVASSPISIVTASPEPFDRCFTSQQAAVQALEAAGYPLYRIESFIANDRIRSLQNGEWWSDVNPDFRRLCYQHILDTDLGNKVWDKLSKETTFPCHVLVAGSDETVCREDSLGRMQNTMKRVKIHRYPTANHSIHSSCQGDFMSTLKEIISDAQQNDGQDKKTVNEL